MPEDGSHFVGIEKHGTNQTSFKCSLTEKDERHDHRDQAVMRCRGQELRQLACMTMKADENGMANSNASRMKRKDMRTNQNSFKCNLIGQKMKVMTIKIEL
jgi:hypothetical protein